MKKGFTLIEIIVCISVIAIIGTASVFGIRYVTKNIKIEKLEQITDKVLQAAEVYIETNKETYNQLYNNKNGVVIPIKTLVNEGLLDLSVTTLEDDDIEDEYVITALTKTPTNDCIDITTSASWNMSKENPIYICANGDGSGNSIYIGGDKSNLNTISKENRTYITDTTRNYVKFKEDKIYRLLYLEKDDSLVLYTPEDTFGSTFNGLTQKVFADEEYGKGKTTKKIIILSDDNFFYKDSTCRNKAFSASDLFITNVTGGGSLSLNYRDGSNYDECYPIYKKIERENNEQYISCNDLIDNPSIESSISTKTYYYKASHDVYTPCRSAYLNFGMYIQLKSCMKITSGVGTSINPYIITDKYC